MKNRQRAILYASLFLLTTVTFGNSSAVYPRKESQTLKQTTLKQLTRNKQRPDKRNNSRVLTIGLVLTGLTGLGAAIVCPQPYSILGLVVAFMGPKIIKVINEHKNSTGHAKSS